MGKGCQTELLHRYGVEVPEEQLGAGVFQVSELSHRTRARLLGQVLRAERGERSQLDVASAANMTDSQLSAYETGRNLPRPDTLRRLAKALGCTCEHLWAQVDQVVLREAGLREETVKRFWALVEPWLRKLIREELEAAHLRWIAAFTGDCQVRDDRR